MQKYVKAYGVFVAMTLVTALLVRPMVNKMNIPLLSGNI